MLAGHYTSDAYPIVYIKRAASTFLREAEIQGGGVTSNFKWQGWSHGQKSKPKKIPRASNKTPKNPMPNLRAIKISRGTMRPGYARTITNLQIVLNTQKNPYLNQATQFKNYLPNFFFPKNPEIENFKPPEKSFDHPYHLKSRVSLTGSSSTVYFLPNEQKIYRGYYTVARRYEFYFRVAKQ